MKKNKRIKLNRQQKLNKSIEKICSITKLSKSSALKMLQNPSKLSLYNTIVLTLYDVPINSTEFNKRSIELCKAIMEHHNS